LRWSFKWRTVLRTGQYYDLLQRGFIKGEDREPNVDGFGFYLDAFRELATSRSNGMEIGPIPFTAIADYFRIYELRDFDEFAYIIRRLDNAFLELNDEANKAERKKNANNNPGKANRN